MPDHPVGLEYLSVLGLPLLDYAELGARLECDFLSLNLGGAANRLAAHPAENLRADPALRLTFARRMRELGLRVALVEGFAIVPGQPANHEADLDKAVELGTMAICAVSLDKDMARTHDAFAALAEAGAARGLVVTTEVGAGVMRDLATARAALATVGNPAFQLLIDAMHFFRRGGSVAELAGLEIGHVQLCDVPLASAASSYMAEALNERQLPGEGELPLAAFLAALPAGVPVGLEIPLRSRFEAGIPLEQSLGAGLRTTRALLRAVRC